MFQARRIFPTAVGELAVLLAAQLDIMTWKMRAKWCRAETETFKTDLALRLQQNIDITQFQLFLHFESV